MALQHHDRFSCAFVANRTAGASAGKWYLHYVNDPINADRQRFKRLGDLAIMDLVITDSGHFGFESIQNLFVCLNDEIFHLIKVFARRKNLAPCESRFVFARLSQRDDELKFVRRIGMTDHDSLRLRDLDREILVLVIGAVRSMQCEFPPTARLEIELVDRAPEILRSPPLRKMLRLLERAKNLLP